MASSVTQRISIIVIAVVMIGGTIGFYFLTIMNNGQQNDQQQQLAALQKQLQEQQQKQQACTDTNTEAALPIPDVYKPAGAVSALQTTDLVEGTGAPAKAGDCLYVKYYGTLASNGTKFDENFTSTSAFAFALGQGQVIEGWEKGLVGMKVGGTRRLVIPASMAYGSAAQGAIPANSDLVFVVKLLAIK